MARADRIEGSVPVSGAGVSRGMSRAISRAKEAGMDTKVTKGGKLQVTEPRTETTVTGGKNSKFLSKTNKADVQALADMYGVPAGRNPAAKTRPTSIQRNVRVATRQTPVKKMTAATNKQDRIGGHAK